MKPILIFATHNKNKVIEIAALVQDLYQLKSLADFGLHEEIPENENTLEGNALAKARYVKSKTGFDCFADDTGLLVDALNGDPGVYSARYAGPENDASNNMDKLMMTLGSNSNRNAHFKTVVALVQGTRETLFEGIVHGRIATQRQGEKGFGYDPIFIPQGFDRSFAEMSLEEKGAISHRGKAVKKLVDYLSSSHD
jgi:XTP/dITP diphosphohydrolase